MKSGIEIIEEERKRQISVKGWTSFHDRQHVGGELAMAAACYTHAAFSVTAAAFNAGYLKHLKREYTEGDTILDWPFEERALKISADPIRNLAKAGALIAAEIERLLAAEGAKDAKF